MKSKITIYKKDGTPLKDTGGKEISVSALEYSGEWMGACNVSVTIENERPIPFSIGDYLDYRGERFEINYDPGKIKSAPSGVKGDGFKYSNIVFNSPVDELSRSEFLDIVLNDNNIHYTALPKFVFYVSSLDDIADRLQANLNEQFGDGFWHVYTRDRVKSVTDRGCDGTLWDERYKGAGAGKTIESTSLSVSSQSCWDVLSLVNSQFDVNFVVRGRNIYIEPAEIWADHIFEYGRGKGLYEIEEAADSSQLVITRLRAYGSDKNLPNHYYAEIGTLSYAIIKNKAYSLESRWVRLVLALEYDDKYFTNKIDDIEGLCHDAHLVKVRLSAGEAVKGFVERSYYDLDGNYHSEGTKYTLLQVEARNTANPTHYPIADSNPTNVEAFIRGSGIGKRVYFDEGAVKTNIPSGNLDGTSLVPDRMSVNVLMLPGFPEKSLQEWWEAQSDDIKNYVNPNGRKHYFSTDKYRPYIESENRDKIGIRPSSVFFDTDNEKEGLKNIYPTIEEMKVDGQRIDEIETGTEESVTDPGVFKDTVKDIPNFDIYLKSQINFDLQLLAQSDFQVNMKDGMCGGRSFNVATIHHEKDGRWRLKLERAKDSDLNLYFPYKDFPIRKGDHFVLTGIDLPKEYIENASIEMLKYAIAKLDDNDYTRKTYTPKVDEIFMARQDDAAESDTTGTTISLYKTLKEGDILQFRDDDLSIDTRITINNLVIKEQDGKIPTFEITLKEEKEVSTIKKIQNQVSSIVSGSLGLGSFTSRQIEQMVAQAGKNHFLSKTEADTAKGLITFLRGIQLGSEYSISELGEAVLKSLTLGKYGITSTGDATLAEIASTDYNADEQSGYGLKKRTDGKYKLSLTDLEVWGKAVFHELELRKLSYVGGNFVFSPAGSSLYHVELVKGDYYCYILADDGEKATENLWKEGDLARCKTFNVKTGVYQNVQNKDYWRKVTWVSPNTYETDNSGKTILAGRKFHLIVLSGTDCMTGSDIPAAGDDICCLGSKTQATERGNAVMINTTGDGAPSFIQYAGINDYTLTGKEVTKLSPSGNIIRGAFYSQNGTKELSIAIDEQGKSLDGLSKTIAELKVEADRISAKVDNVARTYRNLIPDSKVMLRSNGYEVCRRTVRLEAGTVYTLSARGTAENSLTSTGGCLKVYLYNDGWSFAQAVEITGEDQTASVTFDIAESGNYNVAAYALHNESVSVYGNRRPQEKGFFRLDYMQIEEGDTATPWTPAEEDPAVTGNLLPCLDEGGWVKTSGTELTTDAYVVDGRHTTVAHYKDTKNKALLLLQCPVTLDGESTYTLSMWVKGTGTFGTILGPACTVLTVDNQGHEASGTTGGVVNTLTADWRKIIVRWSTAFSVYNMIKNSGYNAAAGQLTSWSTMGTWKVDNGMAHLTKIASSASFGQLSQPVKITAGTIYTLQFSTTNFGMTLLLANMKPTAVILDGQSVTAGAYGSITIAADENITTHTVTFQANNVNGTPAVVFRFTQKYARIGKVMLHEGHIPSVYHTQEDVKDTLVPVQLSAGGEVWVAGVKLEKSYRATEYTERTLTAGQLLPVGIDIEAQKIIATADNFLVRNRQGETTTTITADGQLTAGILATMNRGEGYVKAQDGLMEVFNGKGQLNIQFGLDPNSGMMVLSYYDNLGNLLYNLGPGGLENKGLQTASVSTYSAERLGTFFANEIVMGGVTSYDDEVYHTNSDGDYIIDSKFKSRLMPSVVTGAGYEPKSIMKQPADIYYYRAARVSNAYVADTDNGITTPALAQQADGKWFNHRPLYWNGSLQLITSGVYIEEGEKLHWGTKKNGLNVLAIYVYNYYTDVDGTRERVEVFVE
jgi:hypothetical protein